MIQRPDLCCVYGFARARLADDGHVPERVLGQDAEDIPAASAVVDGGEGKTSVHVMYTERRLVVVSNQLDS